MTTTRTKTARAFTLIELVVVIVVMGILAALGYFAYNAVISSSKADAANKLAHQVARTVQTYSATENIPYDEITGTEVDLLVSDDIAPHVVDSGTLDTDANDATRFTVRNEDTNCTAVVTFTGAPGTAGRIAPGSCPS